MGLMFRYNSVSLWKARYQLWQAEMDGDASSKRTKKSSAKQPKASFGVNPAVISLFSSPLPQPPTPNSAPAVPDVKDGEIKKRKRNAKKIKPVHVKSNAPKSLEEEYESKQAQMQEDEQRKSKKEKVRNV